MDSKSWTSYVIEKAVEKVTNIEHQIGQYEQHNKFNTVLLNKVDSILLNALNVADTEIQNVFEEEAKEVKKVFVKDAIHSGQFHLMTLHRESSYLLFDFNKKEVFLLQKLAVSSESIDDVSIILEDLLIQKIRKEKITIEGNIDNLIFIQYADTPLDWKNALAIPYSTSTNIFMLILVPSRDKENSLSFFNLIENKLYLQRTHKIPGLGKISKICFLKSIKPQKCNKYNWGVSILLFAEQNSKLIEVYLSGENYKMFNIVEDIFNLSVSNLIFFKVDGIEDELFIITEEKAFFFWKRQRILLLKNKLIIAIRAEFTLHSDENIHRIIHCEKKYLAILSSQDKAYLKFVVFDIDTVYRTEKHNITNSRYLVMSTRPIILLILSPCNECSVCLKKHNCYALYKLFIDVVSSDKILLEKTNTKIIAQISLEQLYNKQMELEWFSIQNNFSEYIDFNMLEAVLNKNKIHQEETKKKKIVSLTGHSESLHNESKRKRVSNEEEIDDEKLRKQVKLL